MQNTKKSGDAGEIVAIKYLQNKWYIIKDTNYKFGRFWEIDIIANLDKITIFIEVKYRSSDKFGIWEESITPGKLRKFKKTIHSYCFMNKISEENIRFDVIAIMKGDKSHRVTHYKNLEI